MTMMQLRNETIDAGGRTRHYLLATPAGGFDRLLPAFHGSGLSAARFRSFTGNAFETLPGTAVAYVDGYRGNWNDARLGNRFPARRANIDTVHGGGHTIPGPVPSPGLLGRTTTDPHTTTAIADFFGFRTGASGASVSQNVPTTSAVRCPRTRSRRVTLRNRRASSPSGGKYST